MVILNTQGLLLYLVRGRDHRDHTNHRDWEALRIPMMHDASCRFVFLGFLCSRSLSPWVRELRFPEGVPVVFHVKVTYIPERQFGIQSEY